MSVGRTAYRLAALALSLLGVGTAAIAEMAESFNRYYFRAHLPGSSILSWIGVSVAFPASTEGVLLVVKRRLDGSE